MLKWIDWGVARIFVVLIMIFCHGQALAQIRPNWVFPTDGAIESSPVIGPDGVIYLGSNDGMLYAINPNGSLRWGFLIGTPVISSPAVAADGTVYVGAEDGNLYAIHPDGTQKWLFTSGDSIESSPAVGADGTIYFGSNDARIYALNPDGSCQWFDSADNSCGQRTKGAIVASPAIDADGTVYIGSLNTIPDFKIDGNSVGNFVAFNHEGLVLGSHPAQDDIRSSAAISPGGVIYVGIDPNILSALTWDGIAAGVKWNFSATAGATMDSSAAIGPNGIIYIGTGDNSLYAIDPNNGECLWLQNDNTCRGFNTNGQIVSSPVLAADGTIYVGSLDNNLYAVNPDGTEKWRFSSGDSISAAPAIAADGTVYIGSHDGNLYAINLDGQQKWVFPTAGLVSSTPAVDNNRTVYVGAEDGNLYALNPDGSERWRFISAGAITASPTIGSDGTIYAASWDGSVYSIDPIDGSENWAFNDPISGIITSSPTVTDNAIYIGGFDNFIYALDLSGNLQWRYQTNGLIDSSPRVATDGTIYIGSDDGNLYALDPQTCIAEAQLDPNSNCTSAKWIFPTTGEINSSPAIHANGTIYFGSDDGRLRALNPDGTCQWLNPDNTCGFLIGEPIDSSPVIANDDVIYVGSDDDRLYAINTDGSCRWLHPDNSCGFLTGGDIDSSAFIDNAGIVYIRSDDGRLYALDSAQCTKDPANCEVKWSFLIDPFNESSTSNVFIDSSPVLSPDGVVYIGGGRAVYSIYAFPKPGSWPVFQHDSRRTGLYFGSEPEISGQLFTNNRRPDWGWSFIADATGSFRYALNGYFPVNAVSTQAMTYQADTDLPDGGYVFAVQQQLSPGVWLPANWFSTWIETNPPVTIPTIVRIVANTATIAFSCDDDATGTGCQKTFYSTDAGASFEIVNGTISVPVQTPPQSIQFFSTDRAGNNETAKSLEGDFTNLVLTDFFPSTNISTGGNLTITGFLSRQPDDGNFDLANLPIELNINIPSTPEEDCSAAANNCQSVTLSTDTTDNFGSIERTLPAPGDNFNFDVPGIYTIQASFNGSVLLTAAESEIYTISVGSSPGYAILIQGKLGNDFADRQSHRKTTDRIYQTLLARGFSEENICYFSHDSKIATHKDCLATPPANSIRTAPTLANIQWAIENWVTERRNITGVPAPFYTIMVDHGSPEVDLNNDNIADIPARFYLDDGVVIEPEELALWLDNLEAKLPEEFNEDRVVTIGSCYSGGFIEALSSPAQQSLPARIIITSSAANEESYKGPLEPDDGIRVGEFFLEEFFHGLRLGENLNQAFTTAADKTRIFTRDDNDDSNAVAPYFDNAVQHPLLDDNGDGIGSNILSNNTDGALAASHKLGIGPTLTTNSVGSSATITEITPPVSLEENETSATLFARVQNNWRRAGFAWVEIRTPDQKLVPQGGNIQLNNEMFRQPLTDSDEANNSETARWQTTVNDLFQDPGTYEVFYFVRDRLTDDISPMLRSFVYKGDTTNQPPGDEDGFDLITPDDNDLNLTLPKIFRWESADDPGDTVTYSLLIEDIATGTIVHRQDNLTTTFALVENIPDLQLVNPNQPQATHRWWVIAIDSFGARTESNLPRRSFAVKDPNGQGVHISGLVQSNLVGAEISGISVAWILGGESDVISLPDAENGNYIFHIGSATGGDTIEIQADANAHQRGVQNVQWDGSKDLVPNINFKLLCIEQGPPCRVISEGAELILEDDFE